MMDERPTSFSRPSPYRSGLPSSINLLQTASETTLKPNAAIGDSRGPGLRIKGKGARYKDKGIRKEERGLRSEVRGRKIRR